MRANSLAVAVMVATAASLLFIGSITAPVHAWVVGYSNAFWLWGASFVHIDLSHLLANLLGLVLVQVIFGHQVSVWGWLYALLLAAPLAHALVVAAGHFVWVAGLSTALHAVVGFAALSLLLDQTDQTVTKGPWMPGWRRGALFGLIVVAGLVVKIILDTVWVTYWPQAQAQTSASLHGIAAALGAFGAILTIGPARWTQPIRFRM